jgi:hypothetical protein
MSRRSGWFDLVDHRSRYITDGLSGIWSQKIPTTCLRVRLSKAGSKSSYVRLHPEDIIMLGNERMYAKKMPMVEPHKCQVNLTNVAFKMEARNKTSSVVVCPKFCREVNIGRSIGNNEISVSDDFRMQSCHAAVACGATKYDPWTIHGQSSRVNSGVWLRLGVGGPSARRPVKLNEETQFRIGRNIFEVDKIVIPKDMRPSDSRRRATMIPAGRSMAEIDTMELNEIQSRRKNLGDFVRLSRSSSGGSSEEGGSDGGSEGGSDGGSEAGDEFPEGES